MSGVRARARLGAALLVVPAGRLRDTAARRRRCRCPATVVRTGRLALSVQDQPRQSFSAGFELRGAAGQAGELTLLNPLGGTLAVLRWRPGSATLQRRAGSHGSSRRSTRWSSRPPASPLPVAALFDWLRRRATRRCPAGRPTCRSWPKAACARVARTAPAGRGPARGAGPLTRMRALYDVPAPAKLNLFLHVTGRAGRRLPPAAVGLHAARLARHAAFRAAPRRRAQPRGPRRGRAGRRPGAARGARAAAGHRQRGRRAHRARQAPAGPGRPGRRLVGCGDLPARAEPPLEHRACRCPRWSASGWHWAPTCRSSCAAATPGSKASASGSRPWRCRPPGSWSSSRPQGLETAAIFRDPALRRDSDAAIISGFAANPLQFGRNDLQPVAREAVPAGGRGAVDWLASQGLQGRMTGSGSAVFAVLGAGQAVPHKPLHWSDWTVRECSKLEVHPLVGWAPSDDSVGR